jgi:hypothetical protein
VTKNEPKSARGLQAVGIERYPHEALAVVHSGGDDDASRVATDDVFDAMLLLILDDLGGNSVIDGGVIALRCGGPLLEG